jgi:hypothetical protein
MKRIELCNEGQSHLSFVSCINVRDFHESYFLILG